MLKQRAKIKPLRKIMVPTDFSSCSDDATEYAALVAKTFKARVLLVHVIESFTYSVTDTLNIVDHFVALKSIAQPMLDNVRKQLQKKDWPLKPICWTAYPLGRSCRNAARPGWT